jgi:hypothetical protein
LVLEAGKPKMPTDAAVTTMTDAIVTISRRLARNGTDVMA